MDTQEAKTVLSTERTAPLAEDAKSPDKPSSSSPNATKKSKGAKEDKKTFHKADKKGKKAKARKSKPAHETSSSSSDDDEEEDANSSSDDSTESESESESEADAKKKRSRKKKHASRKSSKKSASSKSKKFSKTTKSHAVPDDEDDEDSDSDEEDDDDTNADPAHGGRSTTKEQELALMKLTMNNMESRINWMSTQMAAQGLNPPPQPPPGSAPLGFGGVPYSMAGNFPPGGQMPPPSRMFPGNFPGNLIRRGGPRGRGGAPPPGRGRNQSMYDDGSLLDDEYGNDGASKSRGTKGARKKQPVIQRMEFKRVDHVWDSQIHNYKLQDTAESSTDSKYNEYLFHVRRTFDWEGKYKTTFVDIKSKPLREVLQEVIGNVKGVSLVDETPKLDPKLLFLYLEDMRTHMNELKELEPEGKTRKERQKAEKRMDEKRKHLKILVKYLDKDFAQIKKSLYPMLENGLITFDLLWALWKPNTLAFTTTYGCVDQPRIFKVEVAEKHNSFVKGEFYYIEGKYLEFDGKQFGYGNMAEEIPDFRGARKITSLPAYPLEYHKNKVQLRKDLIERGKKFVNLGGVHYKAHHGMAYHKKKKKVVKVNINGRIMVDPAIHRRINPNYPVSIVRPKDHDVLSEDEDSDEEGGGCGGCETEDAGETQGGQALEDDDEDETKFVTKVYKDEKGCIIAATVPKEEVETETPAERLDSVPSSRSDDTDADAEDDKAKDVPVFTDEDYLIASPVVLGFAFPEKLWLEFTVSGVGDIQWNEGAYESLVLERKTKDIVKALVESHKYHAAESIDDVIQGKGKGLVAVLHGPPGTGKTLTAEGISELLKCPLYMVSAGDLGTDSRYLEAELQRILDICHAWGAILLLDEADVFLEKRNMQDIHRNALVSIFLRQLEYFQGILFLTTNRVETFDDAFQSRIHIALRYDELDVKARRAIFKMFVERARRVATSSSSSSGTPSTSTSTAPAAASGGGDDFSEADYDTLARAHLNGRQIKNTVGTAQALAAQRREPLSMRHIKQTLDVQQNFERDLKGGPGYQDAMRSYF
ncbi:hypothetical protein F4778DRAFT_785577 [Xylariomycetidae sp. FL2044]|nr:hypothetical protein F4778DRAFT_785577 [Xylariomycetidae sp. FL2044]